MEELYQIYEDTHYKSGWRPLAREEEGSVLTTYKGKDKDVETPPKEAAVENEPPVNSEADPAPEEHDVWAVLSEISAKLDTLSDRVTEQSENINRLLNFLEARAAEGKKGTLSFWGK